MIPEMKQTLFFINLRVSCFPFSFLSPPFARFAFAVCLKGKRQVTLTFCLDKVGHTPIPLDPFVVAIDTWSNTSVARYLFGL